MAIWDISAAAVHFGVDETEVCRRITGGLLISTRDHRGRLCVLFDESDAELTGHPVHVRQPGRTDAEVIAMLRAEVARLDGVCAALRDELQRANHLVSGAAQGDAHALEPVAAGKRTAA